jgi:DNA-binding MarR family transcriptional regulator
MSDTRFVPTDLFCFHVYATNHSFGRFYLDMLAPLGLTYPQFLVVLTLAKQDGQMVRELAEQLKLESNTLSPLLKRMEAQGILTRSRSLEDERKVIVSLTPQGQELSRKAQAIPACVGEALGFPAGELKVIADMLAQVRQRLEDAMALGVAPPA